jgi:hypothetical protein
MYLLFSVMIVDKEGLNICSRRDSMNACGPKELKIQHHFVSTLVWS